MKTIIVLAYRKEATASSDSVTKLRQPARVSDSESKVAILEPETPFHNLHDSRVSRFTMDFVTTGVSILVRGMDKDAIRLDEVSRALQYVDEGRFDAVLLDPSRPEKDETKNSYEQWTHRVQLWAKSPPGDVPSDFSPEC